MNVKLRKRFVLALLGLAVFLALAGTFQSVYAAAPTVTVIAPVDGTSYDCGSAYPYSTDITLEYNVTYGGFIADWVKYSLNGGANVTILGNTTITGVLAGSTNTLYVYANNNASQEDASPLITFYVEAAPPNIHQVFLPMMSIAIGICALAPIVIIVVAFAKWNLDAKTAAVLIIGIIIITIFFIVLLTIFGQVESNF